jgi:TolB protein
MHRQASVSIRASTYRTTAVLAIAVAATLLPLMSSAGGVELQKHARGRIVFQRVYFGGPDLSTQRIALFSVHPDGTGLRQLTSPPRGLSTRHGDLSPDGRRIAYFRARVSGVWRPRIFVMRANGTHPVDLSEGHCPRVACIGEQDPTWSPDGDRLAFTRLFAGTQSIFVMRSDGTRRRRVVPTPAPRYEDSAPSWSPDGRRLVFARYDDERGRQALFAAHLDGTNTRRITPWMRVWATNFPDWSSDGRWIVFHSQPAAGAKSQLCLVHPNGEGFRRITHSAERDWLWGSFSPDGTQITAIRFPGETTQNDLYVMNLDGTGIRPVTESLATTIESQEGVPDWGAS